jgi:hypothetical protein
LSNALAGLPPWSAALPLWAGSRWLWIVVEASGEIRSWESASGEVSSGIISSLHERRATAPYPLLIVDARAVPEPPADWWPRLDGLLEPGGLLLVCSRRDKRLLESVHAHAPAMVPSEWHIIEPGQEDNWHLRPATGEMLDITHDLNAPYSARVWLLRKLYRWRPPGGSIYCLPVWKGGTR